MMGPNEPNEPNESNGAGQPAGEGALRPARWFHLQGGERQGPVPLADMRELVLEGTLGPDSWVWADGMPDWKHVRDVPALVPPRALRVTLTDWPDESAD
jgi:hypothetical protein